MGHVLDPAIILKRRKYFITQIINKKNKRSHQKDRYKRENRCCSSIATHNINKSLMSSEFEPRIFDETRKSNKINLRSKSKWRKTPVNKQNDRKGGIDSSFTHKTSLTLSQMFNYYANHPINEKQWRKYRKNMQNAYRSYTSNSVNKKKYVKSKPYPSIVLGGKGNKKRFTSTNHWNMSKKDKQLAKILDIPLNKYMTK